MVRLSVQSKTNGKIYWVYRQASASERRQTDYSAEKNAALDTSARKYNKDFYSRMARDGYILLCSVDGEHFILVSDDIPLRGASKGGFDKIIQNRYHIKYVVRGEVVTSTVIRGLVDAVGTLYTGYRDAAADVAAQAQARAPPQVRIEAPADMQSASSLVDSFMAFVPPQPAAPPAPVQPSAQVAPLSLQLVPVPVSSMV